MQRDEAAMEIPGRSRMLLVLLLGGQRLETSGVAVLESLFPRRKWGYLPWDAIRLSHSLRSLPLLREDCWLKAGCATRRRAAVLVKFKTSPTARKYRRPRNSIGKSI